LPVESNSEPFPFAAVVALKGLSKSPIIGAAGGIADVADGGSARVLFHDTVVLGLVIEPEGLDNRADLLVRVENLVALGIERAEARRQLAPILQVQQQPGH